MNKDDLLLKKIPDQEKTPLVSMLLDIIEDLSQKIEAFNAQQKIQQKQIETLQTQANTLRVTNAVLVSENKTLKNLPQKPKITASTMDKGEDDDADNNTGTKHVSVDENSPPITKNKNHKTRSKNKHLEIHETKTITVKNLPAGAVFKDYQTFIVQDLLLSLRNVKIRLARYQLADGSFITAEKPSYYHGQFGPTFKAFVDALHYEGRVTQGRIHGLLTSLGADISTGQISHLLTHNRDAYHQEKNDLLTAGLTYSDYIQTDDTTAKHNGKNGYCLFIGNHSFSFFQSSDNKSRLNFLTCLNQGTMSFIINEEALAYCARQKLPEKYLSRLDMGTFEDMDAYLDYLESIGLTSDYHMRLMTEAAVLGSCYDKGYLVDLRIISDDAGQFSIFIKNALCWFHAERAFKKLVAVHPQNAEEINGCLDGIWKLYADLKAYKEDPTQARRVAIEGAFDVLCAMQTTSDALRKALGKLQSNRGKLLLVLDHPNIPLHNNLSENDIREYVMRRKISGSTRSEVGRMCRDTFVSLRKTCVKLGIRFWDFLIDRHMRFGTIPNLAVLVENKLRACA